MTSLKAPIAKLFFHRGQFQFPLLLLHFYPTDIKAAIFRQTNMPAVLERVSINYGFSRITRRQTSNIRNFTIVSSNSVVQRESIGNRLRYNIQFHRFNRHESITDSSGTIKRTYSSILPQSIPANYKRNMPYATDIYYPQ